MALDLAENWICRFLMSTLSRRPRFRDISQATVDLSGSAGYPYKYINGINNKKDFLSNFSYKYEQDLELASSIGFHQEPYYVWDCFPKLEILDIDKRNKKTRLICGAPSELVFLQDNCMGDLNDLMSESPLINKTAIGFNCFLGGWDQLASGLSGEVDFSDAKQWDSSMSPAWLYRVYRIRERLMILNESQRNVLWFVFSELVNSISHLSHGTVAFVKGGNKSGSASTCHDNTIGHLFLIAYCFIVLGYSYKFFNDFFFVVMGDDLIANKFPSGFWEIYVTFGVNVIERSCSDVFQSEFLSHKFVDTPFGVMPYHKNSKMLFSSFNHDSKNWPQIRY